ncbi:hypothetical protein [Fodinicola feengrottensis]|uniref:hypothetical protein n=1 Tax=Fodinicola feengrottensis TaxID=435914 RepID=UPI0013D2CEAD|nr:hypothetical protein [Fodinicola feengrottensis]
MTVDKTFPVRDLAFALRGLSASAVSFSTLPMARSEQMTASTTRSRRRKASATSATVYARDDMAGYLKKHPPNNANHGA